MIKEENQKKIVYCASQYWSKQVNNTEFLKLAKGKEVGHRIADYIDDKTTELLKESNIGTFKFEIDKTGSRQKRSMGDIWFEDKGIYNPINIKAGIVTNGNPNIVSLRKIVNELIDKRIDSYYLLIIKTIKNKKNQWDVRIHFVNFLDYLDYCSFNAGPGQIMLNEVRFYKNIDERIDPIPINKQIEKVTGILIDGIEKVISDRKKTKIEILDKYKKSLKLYEQVDKFNYQCNQIVEQKGWKNFG